MIYLWNRIVVNITRLKKKKLIIVKVLYTISGLFIPAGNIARKQTHAPTAQTKLISFEERRLIIFIIRGMFQSGRIMLAIKAILVNMTTPTA
ncbi:MAG: hypothetical protein AABY55_03015 [Candidatus Omnitrophota bacterium]